MSTESSRRVPTANSYLRKTGGTSRHTEDLPYVHPGVRQEISTSSWRLLICSQRGHVGELSLCGLPTSSSRDRPRPPVRACDHDRTFRL
jgi:hypothetical protein